MPRFDLSKYTDVNTRMGMVRGKFLSIMVSDPVMLTATEGYVKARIVMLEVDDQGQHLTVEELAGFTFGLTGASAQATFPLEDAATSAVGRALGRLGYGTDKNFASREEMRLAQRKQDKVRESSLPTLLPQEKVLKDLRDQIISLGGEVTPLTFERVTNMTETELEAEIKRTRVTLEFLTTEPNDAGAGDAILA